jgi:hypothetical protein
MGMTIEIIDNTTGRPPSEKLIYRIAKEYGLMEMDIDQFAVTEDGHVVLIDDCGRCSYVDTEGFNLRIDFVKVEDGNDD